MLSSIQPRSLQKPPAKKVRRSRIQWQNIMKHYADSGLSQLAFCSQQQIAISSFGKWRQKLNGDRRSLPETGDNDANNLFVEISDNHPDTSSHESNPWSVELTLGNGMILRLR